MKITILVGETGCGKSSIVKALVTRFRGSSAASAIRIGDSTSSCTLEPAFYECGGDFGSLVDTRGTNDSSCAVNDHDVLSAPLRLIASQHAREPVDAHIIWCCNANEKETANYQAQAEFIRSIFDALGDASTGWGSVLVVVKRGESALDRLAPSQAAQDFGAAHDIKSRVILASVIPWSKMDDDQKRVYQQMPPDTRKTLHKYEPNELLDEINARISSMPSVRLHFRSENCIKCGAVGDSRFFKVACHGPVDHYHSNDERYHTGACTPAYENVTETFVESTFWYHPGSWDEWERATRAVATHIFTFGVGTLANAVTGGGIHGAWDCCSNGKRSSRGCKQGTNYGQRIVQQRKPDICGSCRAQWTTVGCGIRCNDCKQSKSTQGCRERCLWCQRALGTNPCSESNVQHEVRPL